MTTHHRRSLVVTLIAFASVAFPSLMSASHSWSTYHWARTSNPFTVKIGDNMTSSWDPYLTTAAADWSASSVMDTPIVAGTSTKQCAARAGRVEVCNRTYGQNGWLGLAQIWLSGGHISQGTAKMNDTYFNMAAYNNPSEKLHVVCQEIGHTFGLGHTSEDGTSQGTCMDYYQNKTDDGISTHPNAHDYAQLESIYAHLDSTNSSFKMPSFMDEIDFAGPGQWGKEVMRSEDGRFSVYELSVDHDHKLMTHVFWAYEHSDDVLRARDAQERPQQ